MPEPTAPEPSIAPEIAAEQVHLDAAYLRLDEMRRSARRVREAYAEVASGGTHQARLERDIAFDITERRLHDLEIADSPLCFGRLDQAHEPAWYIGRLAVDDDERNPLVVDWRAPVAEPFYRATAVEPMGVARRRHFITRGGREIIGLDDEIFDPEASRAAGLSVAGEGALMLALERHRTGRMGDIVATIQAEQDEAIRADLPGVLVVSGGPGTGKTAVALHRAAYLLYTHRRRLASSGVLLVGPSPVFLRYIEQVLPSLGEQDVQLATVAALKPGLRVRATDHYEVAALKGSARMVHVMAKAVADRERALPRDVAVRIDGLAPRITRRASARIVQSAGRRAGTHNEKRPYVVRKLLDHLVRSYEKEAARSNRIRGLDGDTSGSVFGSGTGEGPSPLVASALQKGEAPPDDFVSDLRERLHRHPEVREAIERMWPVLSGAELVNDLFGFRALVRSAATVHLDRREQDLLHRRRTTDCADALWTDADIGLVDEADALLGPVEAARPHHRRSEDLDDESVAFAERVVEELGLGAYTTASSLAERFADPDEVGNGGGPEPRTFGHVMVDEAQDLTAMQWRMLARRCPSGSMTLVGDLAQASRPGALSSWEAILEHLPTHQPPRFAGLSMNYRTPAEIMDVAARLLAAAAPTVEPSQSVRATGRAPLFSQVDAADLLPALAEAARTARAEGGTIVVIAPGDAHAAIVEALADLDAVSETPEALDATVAVLDATTAKGLEFDHVLVVEPSRLVTADRSGLRLLYMTLTRATQSLAVLHSEPLPEALASP